MNSRNVTKDVEIKRLEALLATYQRRHNDVNMIVERIGKLKSRVGSDVAQDISRITKDWEEYDMLYGD